MTEPGPGSAGSSPAGPTPTRPAVAVDDQDRGLQPRHLWSIGLGVVVAGWAVALVPIEPRALAGLVAIAGGLFCVRFVEVAAAGLAFVIAGHLSSVATNVHGLPSPSIGLAAAIVLGIALRADRRTFLPPPRLLLLFAGYGLVVVASVLWAAQPDRTIEAASVLARNMVLGLLVAVVVRRMGSLRLTLWAIMSAIGLLAAVSTVQYLTGTFTQTYGGLGGAVVANIVGGTDDWRVVGPFGDANYYAQALAIAVPIALNRALYERRISLRLLALAVAALATFATVTTFSRGGALTVAVVIVVFLLLRRPRPRVVAMAAVAAVLLAGSLPTAFQDRLSAAVDLAGAGSGAPVDIAVRGRLSEVLAGAAMFRDEPLLGVGVANYPPTYLEYSQEFQLDARGDERSAHSLYIEIAAETGMLGIIAFLALLIGGVRALRRCRRWSHAADPPARGLTEGLALGIFAFLVSSLFLHAAHARIFWLLAAIALALPADGPPADDELDAPADDEVPAPTPVSPTRPPAGPASTA